MRALRLPLSTCLAVFLIAIGVVVEPAGARAATKPHIFQHPALSKDLIAFGYAGDLWTVPRAGGVARRLTTGVGIETDPVFSPDGSMIAFTGDYDGNTDVFTIPSEGGIPFRVTYHPAADFAVAWTADGKDIVFRSTRISQSRYTQLYEVPAQGRNCKAAAAADGVPGAVFAGRERDCVFAAAAGVWIRLHVVCFVGELSRRPREHDLDHDAAGVGFGRDSA